MTASEFDHFLPQRNSLLVRGLFLTVTGTILTVLSVIEPDVRIMSQSSSWLPMVGFVVLLTGIFACFDAYRSRNSKEFYIHLQIAILDTVVAIILLNELNKSSQKNYFFGSGLFDDQRNIQNFCCLYRSLYSQQFCDSWRSIILYFGIGVVAGMVIVFDVVYLFLPQRRYHEARKGFIPFRALVKSAKQDHESGTVKYR